MTKLFNPTEQEITVQIRGREHTIPALGESDELSEADAVYWKDRLHNFLEFVPEKIKEQKPEIEEMKEEEVQPETEAEVVVEEEVEEIKKTKPSKTTSKK